jgi:heptosyltransferase I
LGAAPYLVINPTSSKLERDWPLERQLEFVRRLPQSGWRGRLVIAAGHSARDKDWAAQLAAAHSDTVNLAGALNLPQLFAVIAGAQAVITPDSAPVHIATAYKVPVVGLYAVARCALSGPWRAADYCVDCYSEGVKTLLKRDPDTADWHTRVHHPRAMELISVEQVLRQTNRALADSKT